MHFVQWTRRTNIRKNLADMNARLKNILCKKELVLLVIVALRTLFGLEKASFE